MRTVINRVLVVALSAAAFAPLAAQDHPVAESRPTLVELNLNVMLWVLLIFSIFMWLLKKYALGPIITAVEKREKALEEAIEGAKRDREAAATLLEEQRAGIATARDDAQRFIAEGRATAEKLRQDLLEQARREQQEMLERARQEIDREKERAIMDIRREAVDLAIAGATKVVEQNLDSAANRRLIDSYLGSLGPVKVTR